ncbi:MAG: Na+/H+ antiporter subunit E [Clostridiales bacterium]|nr:Na+/H+ antiporter subunit E [Clostridiales bacterium]
MDSECGEKQGNSTNGSEFVQFIFVAILLFVFWLAVSGLFTPKHITIGAITSVAVAWITRPLLRLPSTENQNKTYLAFHISYMRLFLYLLWLFKEIIKSNRYMIKLILSPKMPIDPVIVTFEKKMDNPLAHLTLGNSIALTPGTLAIEIEDGLYVIHAITKEMGESLVTPDGRDANMVRRVAAIFDERDREVCHDHNE